MKRKLLSVLVAGALASLGATAQAAQGPSSSATPYVTPTAAGWDVTSIISVGDAADNGYKMVGIPDGLGAYDNGNGTFTVLMNHEIGTGSGINRAHGANGAFVSEWIINKSDFKVLAGADLATSHLVWSNTGYVTASGAANSFNRLCSADLPPVTVAQVGEDSISVPLQILALMTALSVLPALLLGMTAFTRIIVVFALLRQALGTGQTPSNQILLGLALFITALIMAPVADASWTQGVQPYLDDQMSFAEAWPKAIQPVRDFMFAQVRENDLMLFAGLAGTEGYTSSDAVPLHVLAASFITSELKTAFQIGFFLFVPFVIIDLVVASVLMSMGMMMLSPMLVSAPFKILLFVLVDGWVLVIGSLAGSFQLVP